MNMNSNADDLSDNSLENDLFFDNLTGVGAASRKPRAGSAKSKTKMDDLFGIKEENEVDFLTQTLKGSAGATAFKPVGGSTPRITRQKPSQSNDDNDDDDDLGFDPKKPKSGNKLNLLDDLLATADAKRPNTAAPVSGRREDSGMTTISRQSTDTTTDNSMVMQARPKTSIGRRSSGTSTVVNTDPLGLFTTPSKDREQNIPDSGLSTPKAKKRSNATADWLGLTADPIEAERKPDEPADSKASISQPKASNGEMKISIKIPDASDDPKPETMGESLVSKPIEEVPMANKDPLQDILMLNTLNLESKSSMYALQQQEAQLALATQMRTHERALLEMQRKQGALLQQQERQFQALFQQQLQRQQQIEEHIKTQHQRINAHIQLMMMQPMVATAEPQFDTDKDDSTVKPRFDTGTTMLDVVQIEADVKRLELEKLRLDELVENMKTNYEREIEMIETSFKKQLHVAEEHSTAVETRFKMEQEDLHEHYQRKLETLEKDKSKLRTEYEAQLDALKQDHEDELRKMKKSYEENLTMLKEEHRLMLESIRQAKMLEFAAVQENGSGSFLNMLKMASSNLENLSGDLEGLREDMQAKIETLHREREKKLELRERRIEDAERRLKITEENAEEEKRRLMELVSSLELQLNKLSKDSAEENWLLRQKMVSLEAEKTAFEQERKYAREQMVRDEQRVTDLKEAQLLEGQRVMAELQEERTRLMVLRAKIETEKKLQTHTNLDNQQMEVEAALKVAQDAARQADMERERFYKMQRQIEQEKRELFNVKNAVRNREEELEQKLAGVMMAERKCKQAQQESEQAEHDFREKIRLLQQRMTQLGEREASLSQDRLLLAQERIALHNQRARLSKRKCTLCKLSAQNEEIAMLISKDVNDTMQKDTVHGNVMPNKAIENPLGTVTSFRQLLGMSNIVDRMLDENIAESFSRMRSSTNGNISDLWANTVLDDDSKELALHNLDNQDL